MGNIRSFLKIHNQDKITKKNDSEKITKYELSEDRADVIDYAMSIYEFVLNKCCN